MRGESRIYDSERAPIEEDDKQSKDWCEVVDNQLEHLGKGTTWFAIIFGQVMSALLCISAFTTVHLVEVYNVRIPHAQNFVFYVLLASVFTLALLCRSAERNIFPILKTRGWKYLFLAILDSEAKYLVNKACQLTSVTSVQLLDCFAIPTILSLSWLVLKIRFKVPHIIGVSICLLGVSCLVWADIEERKLNSSDKDRFIGDMMCLAAAFLMGISNVAQELVVKTFDPVEFLGMIGLFGAIISGAQTVLFEYSTVRELDLSSEMFNSQPIICIVTYGATQAVFYILSTFTIKWSSATLLNLSLLSADFYTLIVSVYFFRVRFHALYFLSYLLVMIGVITFSVKPTNLGSQIYVSLKREITTTLDLELMSPDSVEYSPEEFCVGARGSLLVGNRLRSPMLSGESCDVVLQTTRDKVGVVGCNGTTNCVQGTSGDNRNLMKGRGDN